MLTFAAVVVAAVAAAQVVAAYCCGTDGCVYDPSRLTGAALRYRSHYYCSHYYYSVFYPSRPNCHAAALSWPSDGVTPSPIGRGTLCRRRIAGCRIAAHVVVVAYCIDCQWRKEGG